MKYVAPPTWQELQATGPDEFPEGYYRDMASNLLPVLELTRRNLETLLAKLDEPYSVRSLIDGGRNIAVVAVENEAHYADRAPGPVFINGVLT